MEIAAPVSSAEALALTPAAAARVRALRDGSQRPEGGVRLRIVAGGCSGMQYRIDLADAPRPGDAVVERDGARVFVDPRSLVLVKGSVLDYTEDLMGGGFKVVNPNAKTSCSCGVSFTV